MTRKRKPVPELTREASHHDVVLADGTKTAVAHQLKYGRIRQSYHYYLRWECGGWREFDLRDLAPEKEVDAWLEPIELNPDRIEREKLLPTLATWLGQFTLQQIKAVSPLYSQV